MPVLPVEEAISKTIEAPADETSVVILSATADTTLEPSVENIETDKTETDNKETPVEVPPTETGTVIEILPIVENTGTTNTGASDSESVKKDIVETSNENTVGAQAIVTILTGSVSMSTFKINTNLGTVVVASGTYMADTKTLLIHSGTLVLAGSGTEILSGTINFDANSKLIADTVTPTEIIDTYENHIYGEKRLPNDVRLLLNDFLTKNSSGAIMPVAPTNTVYFNKYVRGLISILLSQPEYVLLTGYDQPTVVDPTEQRFLDNITGKLFFIELYGGNDYLTSIIPKDEYSTYVDYRTNQS